MGINVDEKTGLININTKNSTYQIKVDKYKNLIHTYYGGRIDDTDMYSQILFADRGFSGNPHYTGTFDRTYSLDVLPQEYSCFGTGDYRVTGLKVKEETGNNTVELRYAGYKIEKGLYKIDGLPSIYEDDEKSESLCIYMQDKMNGLEVELWYGILEEYDVIARSAKLINKGNAKLTIEKAASLNLDFQYGKYDWITFYGRHAMERNINRTSVRHGIASIGSVRGNSSHHYNPFSILCEHDATETSGRCYGFSFMYSGEFEMEVELDQMDQTRFVCGIHPDDFSWILDVDSKLELPQVIMSYSENGLSKLSRNYHKTIQNHVCRGIWKNKKRPVLINNWEATYFDFTGDKLAAIAEEAHELGIELFVLDDGWFGKRDNDNCALGDWFPNEEKLGCTLKELGKRITDTGMKFGIWFEPEAISVDSDLYRAHPDWAVVSPGREPQLARNQLVLDFSRKEICDYMIERMSRVIEDTGASYIKWDMNRSICDKYSNSLDAEHQGEFAHRFILGLYYVLEELNKRFPELLIEGCSGGGGRFDAGMLYYTPQIWCSDNTDAINRLDIQYGTSFGYPVSTMGAHVSAVPNHQTGRITPLKTRGCVAMSGTFGYELDITKLTEEEKLEVKEQIKTFNKYYELIQHGNYYRLTTPEDVCTVWEVASEDKSEALITAVYHGVKANAAPVHVSVYGLEDLAKYRVEVISAENKDEIIMSGNALFRGGITLPQSQYDNQAWQIYIKQM